MIENCQKTRYTISHTSLKIPRIPANVLYARQTRSRQAILTCTCVCVCVWDRVVVLKAYWLKHHYLVQDAALIFAAPPRLNFGFCCERRDKRNQAPQPQKALPP